VVLISLAAVAILLAGVGSFYASSRPDGLEYVAETTGFGDTASASGAEAGPLAGYGVAGVDNARLSGGLAGVIGVVVVGALAGGVTLILRRRRGADTADQE
jgi:cobalt/nickel transport system permease protein/cobalt/nickel transport protein